jgi:nitric oxide reductase subunit B
LFTTVMVAYIFVLLGVVRQRIALGIIFLDIILYSAGGVIGTMHHLYFSGTPVEHMALGAFFSAAEVIPLTFLTVEAWAFLQLGSRQQAGSDHPFPHRWAVMFLVAVGFWNFVGAGIFGFLINLPIVSYYQIGTALTANHGHAAMMGVYGMLAVALAMFAFRYAIPRRQVAGESRQSLVLVYEHRLGVDGVRHAAPTGRAAALSLRQRRVRRSTVARLPHPAGKRAA